MAFEVGQIVEHKLVDTPMVVIETKGDGGIAGAGGYVCRWSGKRTDTGEIIFLKDTFNESELEPAK